MFKGIFLAVTACFIWGFIFIIPQCIENFSAIEIALGRYFFYGSISALLFLKSRIKGMSRYPRPIWFKAAVFSAVPTFIYYTSVVFALQHTAAGVCALLLGICPITIAFYGNWKQKECSYKMLVLPALLIMAGLLIINIPKLYETTAPGSYLLGLLFCVFALASWSWFAVANSRFLKSYPEIKSQEWTSLVGFVTLLWVFVLGLPLFFFMPETFDIQKYTTFNTSLITFLIGSLILGLFCSWVATALWNQACLYLPISLAGQLTIFETIFGLIFIGFYEGRFPPAYECLGIALFLCAIIYGIRKTKELVRLPNIE